MPAPSRATPPASTTAIRSTRLPTGIPPRAIFSEIEPRVRSRE
jgi:hypothetical protein